MRTCEQQVVPFGGPWLGASLPALSTHVQLILYQSALKHCLIARHKIECISLLYRYITDVPCPAEGQSYMYGTHEHAV